MADDINHFLVPARLVRKKELGVDLELADATKVSHQFTTDDITAVIGVSGTLEGNVLYGVPRGNCQVRGQQDDRERSHRIR